MKVLSRVFAQAIKVCLAEHQMSQGELAKKIGYSEQQVSRWANCVGYPKTQALIALAFAFDMPLSEFVAKGEESVKKMANKG